MEIRDLLSRRRVAHRRPDHTNKRIFPVDDNMIEKILNNKQQAVLALAVTAMPGMQRVLVVLLVQFCCGLASLGRFTNDVSIAFVMTHFTAIGWASLLLVRVPSAGGIERLLVVRRLLRLIYPILGIGVLFLVGLGFLGTVFRPFFVICLMAGWTGYQLIRHFFIARRDYGVLLKIDLLCTGCTAALLLWPGSRVDPLLAMGLPLAALSAAGLLYLTHQLRQTDDRTAGDSGKDFKSGIELGMTNFLSEGIILLLAPLATVLAGPSYAGLIGLVLSGVGVLLLFPRALAMHHLPELARANKGTPSEFLIAYLSFRRILSGLLLLMGALLLGVATIGGPLFFPEAIALENAWLLFVLLLANTVIGQMGVPDSSRLLVKEQSHLMMRINGAAFGLFVVLAAALWLMPPNASNLVFLLAGQAAISGMRYVLLNTYARRMQYGGLVGSAT